MSSILDKDVLLPCNPKHSIKQRMQWLFALKNSHFVKNMSIVMSGTALAQIIGFALTPVISRLFNSSDFGILGSFTSVLSVVAAVVTLQYSQAVMLPKNDEDAANVFAVSVLSVFAITVMGILAALFFSDRLLSLLNTQSKWLLWLLPLGIFVSGLNQSFQAWCVRRKAFKHTASSQVVRAGTSNILQILAGFFGYGGGGLVASSIAADGTASLNLGWQVFKIDRILLKGSLAWNRMRQAAIEFRDFPIYSASQNMINALSQGLPVLLLAHFYGIAIAGAYAFGIRLLNVPMNFVLNALRQVLFQKASETFNNGGRLWPLFFKLTLGLFAISLVPALILFIWAPQIFSWTFGSEWHTAGVYARWLILWLLPAFCNVPSILFAKILRKQRELFFYECFGLLGRSAALIVGGYFFLALNTVILFSVFGFILNNLLIFWIGISLFNVSKIELADLQESSLND